MAKSWLGAGSQFHTEGEMAKIKLAGRITLGIAAVLIALAVLMTDLVERILYWLLLPDEYGTPVVLNNLLIAGLFIALAIFGYVKLKKLIT